MIMTLLVHAQGVEMNHQSVQKKYLKNLTY